MSGWYHKQGWSDEEIRERNEADRIDALMDRDYDRRKAEHDREHNSVVDECCWCRREMDAANEPLSVCCGAPQIGETDICSACHDHTTFEKD